MLYGPNGCIGDIEFADSTKASLRKIAKELEKANRLKEAELWLQLGETEKAEAILKGGN